MSINRRKTILLAEDNEDSRLALRIFLESLEYDVVEAKNGKEAVRLAQQKKPDLILMDLNLPELDAITAAVVIRHLSSMNEVPILANSSDGRRGIDLFMNIQQLGKGCVGYMTKPINLNELAEQINAALFRLSNAV